MGRSNLRRGGILSLRPATLRYAIGDLPGGTRGLFNHFEGGPHEFCPVDANGMLIGDVWYTVQGRDLLTEED